MRKKLYAAVVTAAVLGLSALTASSAAAVDDDVDYPPVTPGQPSLAGSVAEGVCDGGEPWIAYDLTMTDPDGQVGDVAAVLSLSGSGQSMDIPLGTLHNGKLSGRVLWPEGAAWTQGHITATIHANPSLSVPLAHPDPVSHCANPVTASAGAAGELAYTGSTVSWIAVGAGAGALALGGGLLAMRRRRAHD